MPFIILNRFLKVNKKYHKADPELNKNTFTENMSWNWAPFSSMDDEKGKKGISNYSQVPTASLNKGLITNSFPMHPHWEGVKNWSHIQTLMGTLISSPVGRR